MWPLDPDTTYLNHGSFGSCPEPVLAYQARIRAEMERHPMQFFARELEGRLDEAREALASFLGGDPEGLAFVPNATAGVNAVIRSLKLDPGDQILTHNHAYNACRNALIFAAERAEAEVVVAEVPFPLHSEEEIINPILSAVTNRTAVAMVDHVTSPTALVWPVRRLIRELQGRDVRVLVDGAHAAGMVEVDLDELGADYYTGNCHKWLCSPKGAGYLHCAREHRGSVRPHIISHGANARRTDRSRYQGEFGWTGTHDYSPYLSVPEAIRVLEQQVEGGWPALRDRNRVLCLTGRRAICEALGQELPCPDAMIGSMAALPLPPSQSGTPPVSALYQDPLQQKLVDPHRIEVPIPPWPAFPCRLLRISAQLYNTPGDYEKLAQVLPGLLQTAAGGQSG